LTTELWIAASICFSLVLAAVGWVVQVVLIRNKSARDERVRDIEDRLVAARIELVQVRENLQAASLLSLLFELSSDKIQDPEVIDTLLDQLLQGIEKLPTATELHERIDGLERSLAVIAQSIDRLTRARFVISEAACGPES
jgi:hypothetical protein